MSVSQRAILLGGAIALLVVYFTTPRYIEVEGKKLLYSSSYGKEPVKDKGWHYPERSRIPIEAIWPGYKGAPVQRDPNEALYGGPPVPNETDGDYAQRVKGYLLWKALAKQRDMSEFFIRAFVVLGVTGLVYFAVYKRKKVNTTVPYELR